jgi:Holliday junction resolvase
MVNTRTKGLRAEYAVRDMLRQYTDLPWERTPSSGALEWAKGDLFLPNKVNEIVIEVKHYKDSALSDKILTSATNNLVKWWVKLEHQAKGSKAEPMLFYKYDRSKWFVAVKTKPTKLNKYLYINQLSCYTMLAEDWLKDEWKNYVKSLPSRTDGPKKDTPSRQPKPSV